MEIEHGLSLRYLSKEMVEKIFKRVPFPSLMQARGVCKSWNSFILSSGFLRKCQIPNFREAMPMLLPTIYTGLESWSIKLFDFKTRSMLLILLPLIDASLFPLYLTASCESLICFETRDHQNIIICNPVTMKWKHIQAPTSTAGYIHPLVNHKRVLTGLVVDQQLGTFKLVVASLEDKETFIYDSCDGSWKQGMHAPSDEEFVVCCALTFEGNIYSMVKYYQVQNVPFCSYRLLKYSFEKDRWYEAETGFKMTRKMVDELELELMEHLSQDPWTEPEYAIQPELVLICRHHHMNRQPFDNILGNVTFRVKGSSTGDEIRIYGDFHRTYDIELIFEKCGKLCYKVPGSIVGIGNVLYFTASSHSVSSETHLIRGDWDDLQAECLYTWQKEDPETPMGMRLLHPSLMIDL